MTAIDAQAIRDAVQRGTMSPEQGARMLALHYDIERALFWRAWRTRLRRGWMMPWRKR